jgi:hypothetical protein
MCDNNHDLQAAHRMLSLSRAEKSHTFGEERSRIGDASDQYLQAIASERESHVAWRSRTLQRKWGCLKPSADWAGRRLRE